MKNKIIELLEGVQKDMHFHNIEYSQAYLDLAKAIELLKKQLKSKRINKLIIREK